MELVKIIDFFKNYKRGSYTQIIKETEKNGYKKRVVMVARFVNYYNIKTIKELNKTPVKKDYERIIIPHILKQNTNTNNILLAVYVTNNKKQKAKTTYFYNDAIITEDQYYAGINEKKRIYNDSVIFNFNIKDVVSLGGFAQ